MSDIKLPVSDHRVSTSGNEKLVSSSQVVKAKLVSYNITIYLKSAANIEKV